MTKNPRYHRVLCSKETVAQVRKAAPTLTGQTGHQLTQTQVVDALIAVGLDHMSEVADHLNAQLNPDDEEDTE